MIAKNYEDFTDIMMTAVQKALNGEEGQMLTETLLRAKLAKNPHLTPEEWSNTKAEFILFIFTEFMKQSPELMTEFATHVRNDLLQN